MMYLNLDVGMCDSSSKDAGIVENSLDFIKVLLHI